MLHETFKAAMFSKFVFSHILYIVYVFLDLGHFENKVKKYARTLASNSTDQRSIVKLAITFKNKPMPTYGMVRPHRIHEIKTTNTAMTGAFSLLKAMLIKKLSDALPSWATSAARNNPPKLSCGTAPLRKAKTTNANTNEFRTTPTKWTNTLPTR